MKIKALTVTFEDGSTKTWEGEGHVLPAVNVNYKDPSRPKEANEPRYAVDARITMQGSA